MAFELDREFLERRIKVAKLNASHPTPDDTLTDETDNDRFQGCLHHLGPLR